MTVGHHNKTPWFPPFLFVFKSEFTFLCPGSHSLSPYICSELPAGLRFCSFLFPSHLPGSSLLIPSRSHSFSYIPAISLSVPSPNHTLFTPPTYGLGLSTLSTTLGLNTGQLHLWVLI